MTLHASFWAKTQRTNCIVWTGACNSKGYGCYSVSGVSQLAHRLAWEDARGPIPESMTVDHLCRVRNCVNVDHLELVSVGENIRRRHRFPASVVVGGTCTAGHDITAETVLREEGSDYLACLPCRREPEELIARTTAPFREWVAAMREQIGVTP